MWCDTKIITHEESGSMYEKLRRVIVMAYQPNIPASTDLLSDSQSDIQGNFQAIQTLIDVNHYDFASANQGKHFAISMPAQASSPAIAFAAGEVGLYSYVNATTSQNELYINKTNQATVTQIPATASSLSITSAPVQGTAGWSYLPSGIIYYVGIYNC